MKLTVEPRSTTWVPLIDCAAEVRIEWRCRAEYHAHNALDPISWGARTRYTFTGLAGVRGLPSSQLIVMEQGIPLAVAQTTASMAVDRLQTEEVDDPFVVVSDRVAAVAKERVVEKSLASGVLERTWTEVVERSLRVENRTGKLVRLALTVVDAPAESVGFVRAQPAPSHIATPEYGFALELPVDTEQTIQVVLQVQRRETIRSVRPSAVEAPRSLFKARTEAPMAEDAEDE